MFGRLSKVLDIAAVSITTLLVSACATQFGVTVDSNPKGAVVWEEGAENFRIAPAHWSFDLEKQIVGPKIGCKVVKGFHAQWQSGATASTRSPLNICGDGNQWTVTMQRPSNHPNLEIDLSVEQQFLFKQQLELVKRQREQEAIDENWSELAETLGYSFGCWVTDGC